MVVRSPAFVTLTQFDVPFAQNSTIFIVDDVPVLTWKSAPVPVEEFPSVRTKKFVAPLVFPQVNVVVFVAIAIPKGAAGAVNVSQAAEAATAVDVRTILPPANVQVIPV